MKKILFIIICIVVKFSFAVGSERFTCPDDSNPACSYSDAGISMSERLGIIKDDINKLEVAQASSTVGSIITSSYNSCPAGAIKANGQSTIGYPTLAALGIYNAPDLRGEFIRGFDDGRDIDSGRGFASHQTDEFESHNHTNTAYWHNLGENTGRYAQSFNANNTPRWSETQIPSSNEGDSETRPRNIALLYCIVTGS